MTFTALPRDFPTILCLFPCLSVNLKKRDNALSWLSWLGITSFRKEFVSLGILHPIYPAECTLGCYMIDHLLLSFVIVPFLTDFLFILTTSITRSVLKFWISTASITGLIFQKAGNASITQLMLCTFMGITNSTYESFHQVFLKIYHAPTKVIILRYAYVYVYVNRQLCMIKSIIYFVVARIINHILKYLFWTNVNRWYETVNNIDLE